jgi:TPR repeat protein
MCDEGQGVPQDYAVAVSWYRKAAEQGDADAQVNLGVYTAWARVFRRIMSSRTCGLAWP